jgi:hypothetical protein
MCGHQLHSVTDLELKEVRGAGQNQVRARVARRQRGAAAAVTADQDHPGGQQIIRQGGRGWVCSRFVVQWRSRLELVHSSTPGGKKRRRRVWRGEKLTGEDQLGPIYRLGRRAAIVIPGGGAEVEEDPGQMINPVRPGQAGPEGVLKPSV